MVLSRVAVALVVAAFALTACGNDDDDIEPADPPSTTSTASTADGSRASLVGRAFLSTVVTEDGQPKDLVAGTRVRIDFRADGLSASVGCNTLGATFTVSDGTLVVDEVGTTEMGCDPPRHEQDEWLAGFLTARPRVELTGNRLVLATENATIDLLDRKEAEPDVSLTDIVWVLDTVIDGDAAVNHGVTNATVVFRTDGSVEVGTGCNRGGGQADISPGAISFGPIAVTRMACRSDAAAQVETAMLAVLTGEVTYEVDADRLTITNGARGLGFTADR
jgi:heat shock protein HslJ